jgi:hypothetical protein
MPVLKVIPVVAAGVAALMLAAAPAAAQYRLRDVVSCRTPQGERPDLVVTGKMGAGARRSLDGTRTVIVLNPRQHKVWAMRIAVYFHECAHFSQPGGVGVKRTTPERRRLELRADCVGIRTMARAGLLSRSGWRYILRRVYALRESRSRTHPAGPVRAANMRRCMRGLGHLVRPDYRTRRVNRW